MNYHKAGMTLALLAAGNALALGLGEAVGHAVLGQPLRIEIPLLGSGGSLPAPDCFRIRTPVAEIGGEFLLRNARIQVVGDRGASKLIVTSPTLVREPLVGFAVVAGCGFELTKDYILLTALPTETPPPLPAPALTPPVVAAPAAAPHAPAKEAVALPASDKVLRVTADTTLEALARQKYPAQPKAREKFMRMMARANPGLKEDDTTIAAGTELQIPPRLPQVRIGPYQGEVKSAEVKAAPAPAANAPAAPLPDLPSRAAKPGKDRLVLGAAGAEMSKAKLAEEVERLTAVLEEQTKAQETLTESLAKLEGSYQELQKNFARIEERVVRIEAERLAEKQAPKPASFDFLELLLAVLAGGAVGGLILHGFQRWQRQRNPAAADESPALNQAVAPDAAEHLPWAAPAVPTAPVAPIDEPAAAVAAESGSGEDSAAVPVSAAAEPPVPESAAIPESQPAESLPTDSPSLEFSLEPTEPPEPTEPAPEPLAAETAPPPAVAETVPLPAVEESTEFETFSLDFPPIPVAGETAPETAGMSELPASSAPESAALEPLSLDFPPIPGAEETPAGNPHVIEFAVEPATQGAAAQSALDFPKR